MNDENEFVVVKGGDVYGPYSKKDADRVETRLGSEAHVTSMEYMDPNLVTPDTLNDDINNDDCLSHTLKVEVELQDPAEIVRRVAIKYMQRGKTLTIDQLHNIMRKLDDLSVDDIAMEDIGKELDNEVERLVTAWFSRGDDL